MTTAILEAVGSIVEPVLEPIDGYVVDVRLRGERGSKVLEVFVDTDQGISTDQLAEITQVLSVKLDHADLIPGRYRLEVSSPGLDRPLTTLRQYRKNLGRVLRVSFMEEGAVRDVTGVLESVSDTALTLNNAHGQVHTVSVGAVRRAVVVPQIGRSKLR